MYVGDTNPIPVDLVTMGGATIEFISYARRYLGEISPEGTSIRGIWIHGNPDLGPACGLAVHHRGENPPGSAPDECRERRTGTQ
jgi:hypothetical protein